MPDKRDRFNTLHAAPVNALKDGVAIRRIPEKTFRGELVDLMRKYGAPVEGITGLLSIHFNNGNIDWTKMETNNQL